MTFWSELHSSRLILGVFIISIIIVLRDIVSVSIPDVALLAISCGIMIYLPYFELVPFVFFLFPFTCGIPGYVMLAAYFILFIKARHLSAVQIIPVIIIGILELLNEVIGADFATLSGVMSFLSFTAIFFFFLNDKARPNYDIKKSIFYFGIGTLVTFGVIFFNMLREYGLDYLLTGMARSGALGVEGNNVDIMRGHLAMNANTIAYYAICCVSCLIVLFKSYKHIPTLCIITIIALCGFLTLSRTYILCLGLIGVFYILTASNKMRIGFTFTLTLLFVALSFFAEEYVEQLIDTFVGRSQGSNFATAGGRTILFDEYNEVWLKSLWYIFFGCGVVNYYPLLHCSNAMHSGLQQIWVCLGLTGLLLFVQQICTFLKKYFTLKKAIYILPFLVTLIFDQSIQFLNPYPLMLPIMVSLIVCKATKAF